MNTKQRFGKWIGLMLVAGILIIAAGGCISVKSKTDVKLSDDKKQAKHGKRKIKKSDAYDIAKSLARNAGVTPGDYDIHDKKIDGVYWVLFERYKQRENMGWKNHFAVRVESENRAKLYRR